MKVYMPIYKATVPNVVYEDLDSAKTFFDADITWELKEDYFIGVVDGKLDENFIIEQFEVI